MKFKVAKKSFLEALNHAQSIIERKTTLPILLHVVLEAYEDKLKIIATDMDMRIAEILEANVEIPGKWCVSASLLYDIVRRLEGQDIITLEVIASSLHISAYNINFKIPILCADEFPNIDQSGYDCSFEMKGGELLKLIEETRFCMFPDSSRHQLSGISFEHLDDGKMRAVATDMHRLGLSETNETYPSFPAFILSRKTINEISKMLEDEQVVILEISETKIRFSFRFADFEVSLSARILEGEFPDYQAPLNDDYPMIAYVNREKLDKSIERVTLVTTGNVRKVDLKFGDNKVVLSAQSHDLGSASEVLDVDYDSCPLEVFLNAEYIQDVVKRMPFNEIELHLKGSYDTLLIKPKDNQTCQYAIMPLAI